MSNEIEEVSFKPGDILFHEHEQTFHFFIVQEGEVEVFKTGSRGERIPLATVGAGSSIGEFAMIDRMPRSATAMAKTAVSASMVSDEAYDKLLSELPDWATSVMRALVERLRHTNEVVRRITMNNPEARKLIEVAEYEPDTGSTFADSNPDLAPPEPKKRR